jgi:hypothetical protein
MAIRQDFQLLNDLPITTRAGTKGERAGGRPAKHPAWWFIRIPWRGKGRTDDPAAGEGQGDDLLLMGKTARDITSVLVSSQGHAPFVLAIDALWGMGKSTLMHQVKCCLDEEAGIKTVWFNAWTAQGDDALEGLIKAVLDEIDPHLVRRWGRNLARRPRLLGIAGIGLALAARLFGVARLVDELWRQLALDVTSRNRLRDAIHGMLGDWVKQDATVAKGRCMVVFIDDLDRCTDDVIVQVCEAIKLYLDAPGLIFVLACDQSVLTQGVTAAARGSAEDGRPRLYLEKIVQVVYRLPEPNEEQVKALINGYVKASRTGGILDQDPIRAILVHSAGTNPRRIKRLINSFVLEYKLGGWDKPGLGPKELITAILLQSLYSSFYELLASRREGDPIQDILDYVDARDLNSVRPSAARLPMTEKFFQDRNLPPPADLLDMTTAQVLESLDRAVPEFFPGIVSDKAFLDLLKGLDDQDGHTAFLNRLRNQGLTTEATAPESTSLPESRGTAVIAGWRVLCIVEDPSSGRQVGALLQEHVASTALERNVRRAAELVRATNADAAVVQAGHVEDLVFATGSVRNLDRPVPLVVLYPGVTPDLRNELEESGLTVVVDSVNAVPGALERLGERTLAQARGFPAPTVVGLSALSVEESVRCSLIPTMSAGTSSPPGPLMSTGRCSHSPTAIFPGRYWIVPAGHRASPRARTRPVRQRSRLTRCTRDRGTRWPRSSWPRLSAAARTPQRARTATSGTSTAIPAVTQGSAAPQPRRFPATSSPIPHAMCPHRCPSCPFPAGNSTSCSARISCSPMQTGSTWSFTARRCANCTGSRAVRCGCSRCWSRAGGPFRRCCPGCWQRSTSRTASSGLAMNSSGAATKCWSSTQRSDACAVPGAPADSWQAA